MERTKKNTVEKSSNEMHQARMLVNGAWILVAEAASRVEAFNLSSLQLSPDLQPNVIVKLTGAWEYLAQKTPHKVVFDY